MSVRMIGYARVSTEDQADHGLSLDAQIERLRWYATASGLDLVDIVVDAGKSAKSLKRPGLAQVLARIASGEADGILVAKLDRLSRSVLDWAGLVEDHFGRPDGPIFRSAGDSFDLRTPDGRAFSFVVMVFAQLEREKVVERTGGVMVGKKARNERLGNLRFGTMTDSSDGRRSKKDRPIALVPCPEDLRQLDLMRRLRSEGNSLQAIADELNRLEIPSKRGVTNRSTGRWSKSSVHDFLKRAPSDASRQVHQGPEPTPAAPGPEEPESPDHRPAVEGPP